MSAEGCLNDKLLYTVVDIEYNATLCSGHAGNCFQRLVQIFCQCLGLFSKQAKAHVFPGVQAQQQIGYFRYHHFAFLARQ